MSDLERSLSFYEKVLGLEVTHRIELPLVSEVVPAGADGKRIQLAWQHDQAAAIEHGNGFWKFYVNTDDCQALYKRAIDAGSESVFEPRRLEGWPVTAAFIKDPDGCQIEILQHHAG